jgi:hypothetical protein
VTADVDIITKIGGEVVPKTLKIVFSEYLYIDVVGNLANLACRRIFSLKTLMVMLALGDSIYMSVVGKIAKGGDNSGLAAARCVPGSSKVSVIAS